MIIDKNTKFVAKILSNDKRTGIKKEKIFNPKGVYWQKNNVILVGDISTDDTIRLSLPADIVRVEVI